MATITASAQSASGLRPITRKPSGGLGAAALAPRTALIDGKFKSHLLQRGDRARRPGELENVHAGVGAVDDVDIAAVVDFHILGLDYAVAALHSGVGPDATLVGLACGRRELINVAQDANLRIS